MSALRFHCITTVLAALILGSGPARADDDVTTYRSGDSVPTGYRVERSVVGRNIALTGGTIALGAYGMAAVHGSVGGLVCAGAGYCSPNPAWAFAPVVGPLKLAHDEAPGPNTTFLRIDGALQATGLALVAVGMIADLLSPARLVRVRTRESRIRAVPLFGGGGPGVALAGRF